MDLSVCHFDLSLCYDINLISKTARNNFYTQIISTDDRFDLLVFRTLPFKLCVTFSDGVGVVKMCVKPRDWRLVDNEVIELLNFESTICLDFENGFGKFFNCVKSCSH